MILGLTGGMGCGKSTAGLFLEDAGWRRIDCDALVRDEILTAPAIQAQLQARFGPEVITAEGLVDRPRLAQVIFGDDAARVWLEAIIHPEVRRRWEARVQAAPEEPWVIEVPLLFENGLANRFDFTVCVACAPALQLARLEQRGMDRSLAAQRISKQLPLARKIELSDWVLSNDGTRDFLRQQVRLLTERQQRAG